MKWEKLGLLYCPEKNNLHPQLKTHAANPLSILLYDDVYRIFFNGRNILNQSSIGAVDIDIVQRKIIKTYDKPFFIYGPKGSFYSDGVSLGNCYCVNDVRYMLFMGWQNSETNHWHGEIGRLLVNADLTLALDCTTSYLGLSLYDPISLSYPYVLKENTGKYSIWYGSTRTWDAGNSEMLHVIQHASSTNGHNWENFDLAIPYVLGKAQAFSRPCVLYSEMKKYEMWFSYRGNSNQKYRIGYATSIDNQQWILKLDSVGIDVSIDGWDSEMIEYPFVFDHGNTRYMLYNGNNYGKTGFGLAKLIE